MSRSTKTGALALEVWNAIEMKATPTKREPQMARALHEDLLVLLETGVTNDVLAEFALQARVPALRKLEQRLVEEDYALPKALYWILNHGGGTASAATTFGAQAADVRLVQRLANSVEYEGGRWSQYIPEPAWMVDVVPLAESLIVFLDQRATEDILLPVLEAYRVPGGKGRPFTEVFGICLGSRRAVSVTHRHHGTSKMLYMHISRCVPQLRAKANPTNVEPDVRSFESAVEVAEEVLPQLEVLGNCHSHPYRTLFELQHNPGWELSEADLALNAAWVDYVEAGDIAAQPQVALVVGVAGKPTRRNTGRADRYGFYTHQLTVSGHQLIIGAYRMNRHAKLDPVVDFKVMAPRFWTPEQMAR